MTIDAGALLSELVDLSPEQRMAHLRAAGDAQALLFALAEETDRLATVEVAQAITASEMVVALAGQIGTPRVRVEALGSQAMVFAYAGRLEESLTLCDEAIHRADEAGLRIEAARARLASVHALSELGRYDDAIEAGRTAREAFVAAGAAALAARADVSLGATYDRRDDPVRALEHYDRALPALAEDFSVAAQIQTNRGIALMGLDKFAAAEVAFRAAVSSFEATDANWAAAIAEGNLAHLATRQGRLQKALHHFERARRCLEADESPADLARLLAEQADALATLGMPAEALETYQRVLPQLEAHGLALESAQAHAGLGRVRLQLGRLDEAETALHAAAKGFERIGQEVAGARLDLVRAELSARRGFLDEARSLAEDALEELADRPVDAVLAREHLARYELAAGNLEAAEQHAEAALPVAEGLDIAPIRAGLLHTLGLVKQANADRTGALANLRRAVEQLERVRGTLLSDRFRTAFVGDRLAIYEDAVRVALDGGDPVALAEAFALVEHAKGRALLDLVAGALDLVEAVGDDAADPAEAALLAELSRVRGELNWHLNRLNDDDVGGVRSETRSRRETRQAAIRRLETELDALDDRLAAARGVVGLYAPPLRLEDALRLVPPGSALVEYFEAGDETIAFVLREQTIDVVRGLASPADLEDRVRRVRFQIGRAVAVAGRPNSCLREARLLSDAQRELAALYDQLVRPLGALVEAVDRLIIVPHGALHTLPFGALWDGERYLVETTELVYAPSVSVLAHLPRGDRLGSGKGTALVVGVPDALAPLIGVEADRVAQCLSVRALVGDEATVDRVTSAAQTADVIHLACHGRFSPDRPLTSGLKLADRWLTVRDVYTLRLGAALVTLSGCETGRAVSTGGDEFVGLVRGFLAAGAASLVITLWVVNDESTAEVMADFYTSYRRGTSAASALRKAQLTLLKRRPHPAFWAPFVSGGYA